jgi:hypothetical protein
MTVRDLRAAIADIDLNKNFKVRANTGTYANSTS